MADILEIRSDVMFDESVSHYEVHAHQPYTSSNFNNNDEIRISIQHQELNLLPSRSSIHISGRITRNDGTPASNASLVNCGICHLFDDIRYELNAIEIDRCKNVGLTSVMKGYPSFNKSQCDSIFANAGWIWESYDGDIKHVEDDNGYFDVFIPLSMILGFAEDYPKIIVNMKHELILTRARTNLNAVLQTQRQVGEARTYEDVKITISKLEWVMAYVQLSNEYKFRLLRQIDKPIAMSFRSWELYEYPTLPISTRHVWTVKTSNQLEKPRFVILGFQTNRKAIRENDASLFDHCNLTNVKLFLNSQYHPYNNLNINVAQSQYAALYDMYVNFQRGYYGKTPKLMFDKRKFIDSPLIVIDRSKQNELLKNAPVDVRLEFESSANFPANTSAYCSILHDRIVEYNAVSGDVKKLVSDYKSVLVRYSSLSKWILQWIFNTLNNPVARYSSKSWRYCLLLKKHQRRLIYLIHRYPSNV
uniref:Double jelly roll-like domain-containing protein n=1 Tax=Trichogramma kaykai TaxID=54128 RepID=A0ABD2X030_9HYME